MFNFFRNSALEMRIARMEHLKKIKLNKSLEQLARNHKLLVDLKEVRKDWQDTLGPYHKHQLAKHYGIFEDLYGEGYFIPRNNLEVCY